MNGVNKIFIDTNILIYFLDENPLYFEKVRVFFEKCVLNNVQIWLSTISITEYLIWVYKDKKSDMVFFNFIDELWIEVVDVNKNVAKLSAKIRSRNNEKLPDIINISAAINAWYEYFLTNDQNLKSIIDINIINIDEFLSL